MDGKISAEIMERAQKWLDGNYDEETKKQVRDLIDNDIPELTESFYKDLEFGTGGLRGIMGAGTNRMNIYTVGMATQGLANYLKQAFGKEEIKVVVGHDCRNNSREFAERVADIFASNGFRVYLFDSLRPTPELSFAIRHFGCQSGVMITASHNPKEYNGYKAYWSDGSQVIAPHDTNIIAEVGKITSVEQIETGRNHSNIITLDESFDKIYLAAVHSLSVSPEAVQKFHDIKIVYTPMHGCGYRLVPESLKKFGFTNVSTVKEQMVLDGNFPTVESPNPEEPATMKMALDLGRKEKADIVLATDPDADRVGIAVPDENGNYVLLNGNQTCVLLTYYLCRRWSELGRINGRQFTVRTIVTTDMMSDVPHSFGIKSYDCLTGFKNVAKIVRRQEAMGDQYIGGGEESFGYMAGDFVRDKDGVSACSLAAEAVAWTKSMNITIYQLFKELYVKYGFYKEGLLNVVREGMEGQQEISRMMAQWRANPPRIICGSSVSVIRDYLSSESRDLTTGKITRIDVDKSNVLQFVTADKTVVSVRPSGTEPKIKYYFSVYETLDTIAGFDEVNARLDAKMKKIEEELGLE